MAAEHDDPKRLVDYPYVVLRISCSACRRRHAYRVARLGAAFGAEIRLDALMDRLLKDCRWRSPVKRQKYSPVCVATLPDLGYRAPAPDLPPTAPDDPLAAATAAETR